jgi:hypothetical protein
MEKQKKKNDADVQMKFQVDVKDPGRTAVVSDSRPRRGEPRQCKTRRPDAGQTSRRRT